MKSIPVLFEAQALGNDGIQNVTMDDASLADVMKSVATWDPGNSTTLNAINAEPINAEPINAINVINSLNEKDESDIEEHSLMEGECMSGMQSQAVSGEGIEIRPGPTEEGICDKEGNFWGEGNKAVKEDGLYIFKSGPSVSKILGCGERDGDLGQNNIMGGSGSALSAVQQAEEKFTIQSCYVNSQLEFLNIDVN